MRRPDLCLGPLPAVAGTEMSGESCSRCEWDRAHRDSPPLAHDVGNPRMCSRAGALHLTPGPEGPVATTRGGGTGAGGSNTPKAPSGIARQGFLTEGSSSPPIHTPTGPVKMPSKTPGLGGSAAGASIGHPKHSQLGTYGLWCHSPAHLLH